ncbi:Sedlin [Violaceomyces palustris]|uniref:Sedlin n=1 Tax=Violaceomyces palustris TaxID=1673888 RepID=A0ACD0NUQ7_9BASI|nr:Sedlin [Violaceomyces palustris]
MSYYFCIVGTRDNPLYEAELASKPSTASAASSFFSNVGVGSSSNNPASSSGGKNVNHGSEGGRGEGNLGGGGGVFGLGNAFGALASGLSGGVGVGRDKEKDRDSGGVGGGTDKGGKDGGAGRGLGFGRYNERHVLQMIAHSSLDVVEDVAQVNGAMYLKAVDRINEWTTSAFVVPGNAKFLILHEHKHDDGIRNFFIEIWEAYLKVIMNPFHDANQPIQSVRFDSKVKASARKHL